MLHQAATRPCRATAGSDCGSCASQVWGSWGLTHGPVLWLSFHFLVAVAQNSDHGLSSRLATGLRSAVQLCGCCRCGPASGSAFPVFSRGLPDLSASAASPFRDLSFYLSRARSGCLGEGCSWGWKPLPPLPVLVNWAMLCLLHLRRSRSRF